MKISSVSLEGAFQSGLGTLGVLGNFGELLGVLGSRELGGELWGLGFRELGAFAVDAFSACTLEV